MAGSRLGAVVSGAFIAVNRSRYAADARAGYYESFFQRANHPTRPLAFWIRYTRFSPLRRPQDAVGELWAVYFDGERGVHAVAKEVLPMSACHFACDRFDVRVGAAVLDAASLRGAVGVAGQRIGWELSYLGDAPPLFLLPRFLYAAPLPRAKALVGLPLARFDGRLQVAGETVEVDGWIGSQNHNWGSRHTDRYAWGQVAGFDEAPDSFLELATAQLRIGPWWTPPLTPIVLRHEGVEHAFRALHRIAGTGAIDGFHWRFSGASGDARIEGSISARPEDFVGLRYDNPPGGVKWCLNSKLARCALRLQRRGHAPIELHSAQRAAFEILTDDSGHGVAIRA